MTFSVASTLHPTRPIFSLVPWSIILLSQLQSLFSLFLLQSYGHFVSFLHSAHVKSKCFFLKNFASLFFHLDSPIFCGFWVFRRHFDTFPFLAFYFFLNFCFYFCSHFYDFCFSFYVSSFLFCFFTCVHALIFHLLIPFISFFDRFLQFYQPFMGPFQQAFQ